MFRVRKEPIAAARSATRLGKEKKWALGSGSILGASRGSAVGMDSEDRAEVSRKHTEAFGGERKNQATNLNHERPPLIRTRLSTIGGGCLEAGTGDVSRWSGDRLATGLNRREKFPKHGGSREKAGDAGGLKWLQD